MNGTMLTCYCNIQKRSFFLIFGASIIADAARRHRYRTRCCRIYPTHNTRIHITRTTTTYATTMIIVMMMVMMMIIISTMAKVCRSIFSISSHVNWPSTRLRDNVPWCERDMCSAFRRSNPPPVIGLFLSFKFYIITYIYIYILYYTIDYWYTRVIFRY